MSKFSRLALLVTLLVIVFILPLAAQAKPAAPKPVFSSASELINAVNAVRASYGLPPYNINSILMVLAQGQADYAASGGGITHLDAFGQRPYQRAIAAGYMVAGDFSNGRHGWFSENIYGGKSIDEAMQWWMESTDHTNTILSPNLQDIGAGVGVSGDFYYYVIDCGLSTGASSVSYSPPSTSGSKSTPTFIPNTPNADGSIVHIVQPGDTPLGIAIVYGISLTELFNLNNLTERSVIYPEQPIVIRVAYTPTPTEPTSTPTIRPTMTPWPTSALTDTPTDVPTPTPSTALPVSAAGSAVAAIAVTALVLAGLVTLLGRRRKL